MRSWKGMSNGVKAAVVVVAVLAVAIVGVLVTLRAETQDRAAPTATPSAAAPEPGDGSIGRPFALGVAAKIGSDYRVTVTKVGLYRGYKAPFIAVTLKVEYSGAGKGEPWTDLETLYSAAADSRTFGVSPCQIDLPEASDLPALSSGDVKTYVVCIIPPTKEIKGGTISVDAAPSSGHPMYWSTDGVVRQAMPNPGFASPTPSFEVVRPPPAPKPDPSAIARKAFCGDYDDDDLDDYKDWGKEVRKQHDQGLIDDDDFDDWKDDYEPQLKALEKLDDLCS